MNTPIQSLFEEMKPEPVEQIDLYLPVCENYLKEHPLPKFPPNPQVFSQEALSQRPGMEWLQGVSCNLIAPSSKEIETQKAELDTFFNTIDKDAMLLQEDFCSGMKNNDYKASKFIALDLETTGLDTRVVYKADKTLDPKTKIVGVCIATSDTVGYYLPVMHTEEDGILNWDYTTICDFIQRLTDYFLVIYHNAQYDKEVMSLNGISPRPFPYFLDTMVIHYLADVNVKRHGLKAVSEEMLGRRMIEISQLFSETGVKTKAHINFNLISASTGFVYGNSDAINTMGLFCQLAQMQPENNVFVQQPVPLSVDHKLIDTLRNMYRSGFPVNYDFSLQCCKDILVRIATLEKKMYEFVGRPFDIQSSQQVSKLLFEEYKIPPIEGMTRGKPTKANPEGLYSTDADTLDALYEKHPDIPILEYIVQYRQLDKTLNTVFAKLIVNSYVDAAIPFTRVKAAYSITVIPTGRLSSSSNDGREGILVHETKKGNVTYNYHKGAWDCGFNTQGIPKPDNKIAEAKKIIKLPEEAGLNLSQPYPPELELELIKLLSQV